MLTATCWERKDKKKTYREAEEILGDAASGCQHSGTAVLDLGLLEVLGINKGGDAEGIETNVA